MAQSWQSIAQAKREKNRNDIPLEWRLDPQFLMSLTVTDDKDVTEIPRNCRLLSKAELDITENHSAVELTEKIRQRHLSSVEVTQAFCKRAAIAHQLVNCCTELPFDQAIRRAQECDEYLAREGKTIGPLHGLPISVKDIYNVPGTQTTCGYVAWAADPVCSNAQGITATLLKLGAVIHVKTNMSQMGFAFDTDNNLFGRTLNPLRTCLTPGGSSGGESALLALRGSVLGVGTDALGSLRSPAHCTGLHTIKPSPSRVPFGGRSLGRSGVPGNPIHVGPLAHCVEDLELFMRSVIQSEPWDADSTLISLPWADEGFSQKTLRIGVIVEDPEHVLHPPMLRAMELARRKLEVAGHTLVSLEVGTSFPSLAASVATAFRFASMDAEATAFQPTRSAGEPLVPSVRNSIPPEEVRAKYAPSLQSLVQANVERGRLNEEVLKAFVEQQLDTIMMPVHETVAPPADTWNTATYMAIWNVLPCPAIVVPFSKACEAEDAVFYRRDVKLKTSYDAEKAEGMPCSLQFVGRAFRDEQLLSMVKQMASVIGHHQRKII